MGQLESQQIVKRLANGDYEAKDVMTRASWS